MNRDAMAAFFYRAAGSPHVDLPATSHFSDVSTDNQFYREITWLASKGISTGWPDGTYRPVTPIAATQWRRSSTATPRRSLTRQAARR